jgi:hypothetical protein
MLRRTSRGMPVPPEFRKFRQLKRLLAEQIA